MKRFKFSLQPVFNYKLTVEKLQKADLSKAQQALNVLLDEDRRLDEAYENTKRSLEAALEKNTGVAEALAEHDAYFRYLREAKKALREKIRKAEEVRDKCQQLLITTMKEIKAYTKLREEQYLEYRKEVQAEEDKTMGDLVSFKAISE